MHLSLIFLLLLIFHFEVQSQEVSDIINIIEEGELSNEESELEETKSCDTDGIEHESATVSLKQKFKPIFEFKLTKITGINSNPTKRHLDINQTGFQEKWEKLISAEDSETREKVTKDICSDMSQEDAIRFAGYMGKKNGAIYDYSRTNAGSGENLDEIITIDNYYEVHRNNEFNLEGRKEIGVCGDSARVVAEFLSSCHFSCGDIDVTSYRTKSGGHQMVTARGSNGELYSANWGEATSHENLNPLQYSVADPNIVNTSSHVKLFDCNGKPKGHVSTPLGTILLMAHDAKFNINGGQEYQEIEILAKHFGTSEAKLKAFRARDQSTFLEVEGLNGQITQNFGSDKSLLLFQTKGSFIIGRANRDISSEYGSGDTFLEQNIKSFYSEVNLGFNAIKRKNITVTPFLENSFFVMNTKNKITGSEEIGNQFDASMGIGLGIRLKGKFNNISHEGQIGLRGTGMRNYSQKGGELVNGEVQSRSMTLTPNHVYGRGKLSISTASNKKTSLEVEYDNFYLMGHSQFKVNVDQKIDRTTISPSLTILKNPTAGNIKSLGLSVKQELKLKKHLLEVGANVQYVILNQKSKSSIVDLSIVYKISGK